MDLEWLLPHLDQTIALASLVRSRGSHFEVSEESGGVLTRTLSDLKDMQQALANSAKEAYI